MLLSSQPSLWRPRFAPFGCATQRPRPGEVGLLPAKLPLFERCSRSRSKGASFCTSQMTNTETGQENQWLLCPSILQKEANNMDIWQSYTCNYVQHRADIADNM